MTATSRILIAGASGQVASALREGAAKDARLQAVSLGRDRMDVTDPNAIAAAFKKHAPDVVVNAAAYTAVDGAETDVEAARAVNRDGAANLARAAAAASIRIIHLSTDYVFDGSGTKAWREDDPTGPLGVYGQTKLEGENEVAALAEKHVILRTSWVYSPFGKNFVKTMLRVAADREELNVVADQIGAPTSAFDIADAVLKVINAASVGAPNEEFGIFHMAGSGETSWAGFAEEIFRLSAARGGPSAIVNPIPTSDYPTPARRPTNSRLNCEKLARLYDYRARDWRESLAPCVERIIDEDSWRG